MWLHFADICNNDCIQHASNKRKTKTWKWTWICVPWQFKAHPVQNKFQSNEMSTNALKVSEKDIPWHKVDNSICNVYFKVMWYPFLM